MLHTPQEKGPPGQALGFWKALWEQPRQPLLLLSGSIGPGGPLH